MSDIRCVVCGEPWDSYGVSHGDMLEWEADLFKKGAGCPCCEGKPTKKFEPQSIFDFENGDGDEMERIIAYENSLKNKIEWKKPEPKILWQCDGCGVQVTVNPDVKSSHEDYLEYHIPKDAKCNKWYHSHNFNNRPTEAPAHVFTDGRKVCEYCLDRCYHCGGPICATLDFDDIYQDGYSIPNENYSYSQGFCINCFEQCCSECNCLPDDCECNKDSESEDE